MFVRLASVVTIDSNQPPPLLFLLLLSNSSATFPFPFSSSSFLCHFLISLRNLMKVINEEASLGGGWAQGSHLQRGMNSIG
jgi:hypothetical protein